MTDRQEIKQSRFQEMLDEKMFDKKTVRTVLKEIYNMAKNDRKDSSHLLKLITDNIKDKSTAEMSMPTIESYMKLRNNAINQLTKLMDGINKIMSIASRDEVFGDRENEDFNDDDKLKLLDDDEDDNPKVFQFDAKECQMSEVGRKK